MKVSSYPKWEGVLYPEDAGGYSTGRREIPGSELG
jgi:hypothetical protein